MQAFLFARIYDKRQLEEQRLVKINIPEVFKVWRQLIYHKHKWVTASMKVMIDLIRDYEYDKRILVK